MKIIIIEENNDTLELLKGLKKEINNLVGTNIIIKLKKNYKGNLVPSIDKIIGEVYKEHYDMHRRGAFSFPEKKEWIKSQVKMFKLNNPTLLQNGVETDKKQPKTFICSNDNGETWFTWYKLTNLLWAVDEPESRHLTTKELINNIPNYTICKPIY